MGDELDMLDTAKGVQLRSRCTASGGRIDR